MQRTVQRLSPQKMLVGALKFLLGVALALGVLGLAGAATARYFLTQLASLPERPVYSNDPSEASEPNNAAPEQAAETEAITAAAEATSPAATPPEAEQSVLYQVSVTYGVGLVVRSGPGTEYGSVGGVDYSATLDVLEENSGWLKIKGDGQEGWIKGQGNTRRL